MALGSSMLGKSHQITNEFRHDCNSIDWFNKGQIYIYICIWEKIGNYWICSQFGEGFQHVPTWSLKPIPSLKQLGIASWIHHFPHWILQHHNLQRLLSGFGFTLALAHPKHINSSSQPIIRFVWFNKKTSEHSSFTRSSLVISCISWLYTHNILIFSVVPPSLMFVGLLKKSEIVRYIYPKP